MAWNRGIPGSALAACAIAMMSAAAAAQAVAPNYSWNWATIGALGNLPTRPEETPQNPLRPLGSVGYTYRMATTEVTASQWLEFVQGYAQYVSNDEQANSTFTSQAIRFAGRDGQNRPRYVMNPSLTNVSVDFSWRYAARFCNWLHNGKALTRDAYESGAYDTSTFTQNPDGTYNDQATHSPGARFWIPTTNEWIKAAYFDPNRYGAGQPGYWQYPGGQDTPLTPGAPGTPGAQTSAGWYGPGASYIVDVGAYPNTNAPWGLLDTSGGVAEWTENLLGRREREHKGTVAGGLLHEIGDLLGATSAGTPDHSGAGLRLASIPAPGTSALLLVLGATLSRRSRHVSRPSLDPGIVLPCAGVPAVRSAGR